MERSRSIRCTRSEKLLKRCGPSGRRDGRGVTGSPSTTSATPYADVNRRMRISTGAQGQAVQAAC
eukprot:6209360-Pleurochrysis_carterae.AAC.4